MAVPNEAYVNTLVTSEETKFCPGCDQFKRRSAFGPRKQSKDGLRPRCNACRQLYQTAAWQKNLEENRAKAAKRRREKYQADPAAGAAVARAYRERNPRPKKPRVHLSEEEKRKRKRENRVKTYQKHKAKVLAQAAIYRAAHKEEERANRAAHYQRNKEHVARVAKAYRLANPEMGTIASSKRRARKRNARGNYTRKDIFSLLTRQKGRCAHSWCRKSIKGGYHIDHIMPLSRGGSNDKTNLQLLCPTCNLTKSAKHPIDFAQQNGMLL